MYEYEHPHPSVTTDIVIFTIREARLEVLLIRRAHPPFQAHWALPGGFVGPTETLEACARRELEEETGLTGVCLDQLHAFGDPERDPRERVITVAHCALVPPDRATVRAATDAEAVGWFPLDELPRLAFDHERIIALARERLAVRVRYSTIALQFMPETFTLSELRSVCEVLLPDELDQRTFREQIFAQGHIEATGEQRRAGPHRPEALYRVIDRGRTASAR